MGVGRCTWSRYWQPLCSLLSSPSHGADLSAEVPFLVIQISKETFLCDCILHKVLRDGETLPTSYGRSTSTVPAHLFRHLAARDGGCRYPGCNRPVNYTEAHHIHYWEHGGPTDLDNLVLFCSRHPAAHPTACRPLNTGRRRTFGRVTRD